MRFWLHLGPSILFYRHFLYRLTIQSVLWEPVPDTREIRHLTANVDPAENSEHLRQIPLESQRWTRSYKTRIEIRNLGSIPAVEFQWNFGILIELLVFQFQIPEFRQIPLGRNDGVLVEARKLESNTEI